MEFNVHSKQLNFRETYFPLIYDDAFWFYSQKIWDTSCWEAVKRICTGVGVVNQLEGGAQMWCGRWINVLLDRALKALHDVRIECYGFDSDSQMEDLCGTGRMMVGLKCFWFRETLKMPGKRFSSRVAQVKLCRLLLVWRGSSARGLQPHAQNY